MNLFRMFMKVLFRLAAASFAGLVMSAAFATTTTDSFGKHSSPQVVCISKMFSYSTIAAGTANSGAIPASCNNYNEYNEGYVNPWTSSAMVIMPLYNRVPSTDPGGTASADYSQLFTISTGTLFGDASSTESDTTAMPFSPSQEVSARDASTAAMPNVS